jgi:hypothetical protein
LLLTPLAFQTNGRVKNPNEFGFEVKEAGSIKKEAKKLRATLFWSRN